MGLASSSGVYLSLLPSSPPPHPPAGRIFQFVHGQESSAAAPLLTPANLPLVVEALLKAIRDAPHIAEKVCYAVSQLAAGFPGDEQRGTSPLSPYFKDIVSALLETVRCHTRDSALRCCRGVRAVWVYGCSSCCLLLCLGACCACSWGHIDGPPACLPPTRPPRLPAPCLLPCACVPAGRAACRPRGADEAADAGV